MAEKIIQLDQGLEEMLRDYSKAKRQPFAGHPVATYIRQDLPDAIENMIGKSDRYKIQGSPGQGNWAGVPWVAIFDLLVTDTAQRGYYIVYLFSEDGSSVYLSLNQGVTTVQLEYGADAKHALKIRSADYLARLGAVDAFFSTGPIDLHVTDKSSLGAYYEIGSICSKKYSRTKIPSPELLLKDLNYVLSLYDKLTKIVGGAEPKITEEPDEAGKNDEDLTELRYHKRIERNRTLAQKAKKIHGYICQACGFNFEQKYGTIGKQFIEAHHLVPLAKLIGQKVTLNPKSDFAVLCSNCHRMIHRSEHEHSVQQFKQRHLSI